MCAEDIRKCDLSIVNGSEEGGKRVNKIVDFAAVHIGFNIEQSLKELQ
jgi:hypothetical protein